MKKLRFAIALLMISSFSLSSFAQSDVSGEWLVGEQNTLVKIEQHHGIHSGNIVSSDNPKAEIGKQMVKELKQTKGTWKGKVYAPNRKAWYDAEFTRKGNQLMIVISVGIFSRTIEWTKE